MPTKPSSKLPAGSVQGKKGRRAPARTVATVGKGTVFYTGVKQCRTQLLCSTVLCVDPSIGSTGSQPGWAVSHAGVVTASGVMDTPRSGSLWDRLQAVHAATLALVTEHEPEVMVIEDIAPRRYGGGNAAAHASLLKAVGAILAVPGPSDYVLLKPTTWKSLIEGAYVKGDEEDARQMLLITLRLARHMSDQAALKAATKASKPVTGKKKARASKQPLGGAA